MKVAFVGKGGSGKTTLAALFLRHVVSQGYSALGFDADINQHLAGALGATPAEVSGMPALGSYLPQIKDYLRGENLLIQSAESMLKTTPAGRGSRLIYVNKDNPMYQACVRNIAGVSLAVAGQFSEEDLGVACYHSKVGAVELLLNHMVDQAGEYVVVDMTAGADSFASGLFTRFDVTFLVCEPTVRSVSVYRQYLAYAQDFGVKIAAIGNKVADTDDLSFLQQHIGEDLLAWVTNSRYVKVAERSKILPLDQLEPANLQTLRVMQKLVDTTKKDWRRFQQQAIEFHIRNAKSWANERLGRDLTEQIDAEFTFG